MTSDWIPTAGPPVFRIAKRPGHGGGQCNRAGDRSPGIVARKQGADEACRRSSRPVAVKIEGATPNEKKRMLPTQAVRASTYAVSKIPSRNHAGTKSSPPPVPPDDRENSTRASGPASVRTDHSRGRYGRGITTGPPRVQCDVSSALNLRPAAPPGNRSARSNSAASHASAWPIAFEETGGTFLCRPLPRGQDASSLLPVNEDLLRCKRRKQTGDGFSRRPGRRSPFPT